MPDPDNTSPVGNKFRKKPVVIEAVHWLGSSSQFETVLDWASKAKLPMEHRPDDGVIFITTLEGVMCAARGDWIIKGVKGEIYPCKPDIFAATYEPAASPAPPDDVEAVAQRDYRQTVDRLNRTGDGEMALADLINRLRAGETCSGNEPGLSVLQRAANDAAALLTTCRAPDEAAERRIVEWLRGHEAAEGRIVEEQDLTHTIAVISQALAVIATRRVNGGTIDVMTEQGGSEPVPATAIRSLSTASPEENRMNTDERIFPEQRIILDKIADGLSYRTPLPILIRKMKEMASSGDMRPREGDDIARTLLHNGADQLELLSRKIDVRPWRTFRQRIHDARAVFDQRAVAVFVEGTVYDRPTASPEGEQ